MDSWSDVLQIRKPLIFAILNVTPDSFSDGGEFLSKDLIAKKIDELIDQGADVIDVGAESTRPGALEVKTVEQLERLQPVFELVNENNYEVLFSCDTRNARVAKKALEKGFRIINDVSGARFDPEMLGVMSDSKALVVLMHSRGTPESMNDLTKYGDVVVDVANELNELVERAEFSGVHRKRIMVDPGIGFAKTPQNGLEILDRIGELKKLVELPNLVGLSRKTIVSYVMSGDPKAVPFEERDIVSAEMGKYLIDQGVEALRVHNVVETVKLIANS